MLAVAIASGVICDACRPGAACFNEPRPSNPLCPPCPTCDGKYPDGCPTCGGWGTLKITQCPYKIIPPWVWRVIRLAHMARKGNWPWGRGVMRESQAFIEACQIVWNEEERLRRARRANPPAEAEA